jgi:hypothetical protein
MTATSTTHPALFAANVAFSTLGDGAATRAGTLAAFAALAFLGYRLFRGPAVAGARAESAA